MKTFIEPKFQLPLRPSRGERAGVRWGFGSEFSKPLTLALSPRRGNGVCPSLILWQAVWPTQSSELSRIAGTVLPLPGGEGRGEGGCHHHLLPGEISQCGSVVRAFCPPGGTPRLYGRQDARRYATFQLPLRSIGWRGEGRGEVRALGLEYQNPSPQPSPRLSGARETEMKTKMENKKWMMAVSGCERSAAVRGSGRRLVCRRGLASRRPEGTMESLCGLEISQCGSLVRAFCPPGGTPRLYGRQDARRYATFQLPLRSIGWRGEGQGEVRVFGFGISEPLTPTLSPFGRAKGMVVSRR